MRLRRVWRATWTAGAIVLTGCLGAWSSPPPIAAGIPKLGFSAGAVEFNRRLQQKFPIGSREEDLVGELQREGFKRREYGAEHGLYFVRGGFPCGDMWTVGWLADTSGTLTKIEGSYYDTGCP